VTIKTKYIEAAFTITASKHSNVSFLNEEKSKARVNGPKTS
jgi:hypothetical protein